MSVCHRIDQISTDVVACVENILDQTEQSNCNNEEFSIKMLSFESREKKQYNHKVSALYDEIKEKDGILLDKDILEAKIASCEETLKKLQSEQKMKNIIRSNLQLVDTLQKIVGTSQIKRQNSNEVFESSYSMEQQRCITDLLKRKKALTQKVRAQYKEIISIEENPIVIHGEAQNEEKHVRMLDSNDDNDVQAMLDDLNRCQDLSVVQSKCKKLHQRTQLLSWVLQSLVSSAKMSSRDHIVSVCSDIQSGSCYTLHGTEEILKRLKTDDENQIPNGDAS